MKNKIHHIVLKGFPIENGKVPLGLLNHLNEFLRIAAGGSLRILKEGVSQKKGPKPSWFEDSVNFQLSEIRKGSTDLTIEAPVLKDVLNQLQLPLFDRNPEVFQNYTGIDLAIETMNQAFQDGEAEDLLDRNLLTAMEKHRSLFRDQEGLIQISGYVNDDPVEISYESFDNIKKLKERTPPSTKARVSGTLELMKYSKDLLQIQTKQGMIRAILTEEVKFEDVSPLFGKKVTLDGVANFKPSGKLAVIEVSSVRIAMDDEYWFNKQPALIKEQLDIKQLRAKQEFKGSSLNDVVGQWPGDESIEELIEMRNK